MSRVITGRPPDSMHILHWERCFLYWAKLPAGNLSACNMCISVIAEDCVTICDLVRVSYECTTLVSFHTNVWQ